MNTIKANVLQNLDSIVLAVPSAACLGIGAGFRLLQEKNNIAAKAIGYLGARTFVALGVITALPLLVWNCAKAIFAKMLNLATFKRVPGLRNYSKSTDLVFKITIATIPAAALATLTFPTLIKGVKTLKDFFEKGVGIVRNVQNSINHPPSPNTPRRTDLIPITAA
jgi:hypothetical protein